MWAAIAFVAILLLLSSGGRVIYVVHINARNESPDRESRILTVAAIILLVIIVWVIVANIGNSPAPIGGVVYD